jgi:hypothetical protein
MRLRRLALTALILPAALAITGCTDTSRDADPPRATAKPTPTGVPASALPAGVTGATSIPASPPNEPGLRANATLTRCKSTSEGWKATGVVTNPGTARRTYTITVFFTTRSATVLGWAETQVTVQPRRKATWTVTDRFVAPAKTLCVLRGVG